MEKQVDFLDKSVNFLRETGLDIKYICGVATTLFILWILRRLCKPADIKLLDKVQKSQEKQIKSLMVMLKDKDDRLDACHKLNDDLQAEIRHLKSASKTIQAKEEQK